MSGLPLRLALSPLLATRTPDRGTSFTHGYALCLPDGPRLLAGDPLLSAHGACTTDYEPWEDDALQPEGFGPGRTVALRLGGHDEDGDPVVEIWDAEEVRCAGPLPYPASRLAAAAIDAGLEPVGVVVEERRSADEDRRTAVLLVIHSPALVAVDVPAPVARPVRPVRPRLVFDARGPADVRLWDPAAGTGPLTVDELALSPELRRDFDRLHVAMSEVEDEDDAVVVGWGRDALDDSAQELFVRTRAELALRYRVGYLGRGMGKPTWTLGEDADD